MRSTTASRMLWRLLALGALAVTVQLVALPETAWARYDEEFTDGYEGDESGDSGPGTRWRKCRDTAWADYNECLMQEPDDTGNRAMCYLLWEADASTCDIAFVYEYASNILRFFK